LLALALPAEAKIVYTPANQILPVGDSYLDLNHDGVDDFKFTVVSDHPTCSTWQGLGAHRNTCGNSSYVSVWLSPQGAGNAFVPILFLSGEAAALPWGAPIKVNGSWGSGRGLMACGRCFPPPGYWINVKNRYLGLKFVVNGETHLGWARLNVKFYGNSVKAVLTGYAYETIPNKNVRAGDNYSGPRESASNPTPDAPQIGSLGALALGAEGIPLWRRKESDTFALGVPSQSS
jgi:hypothetical protein